jgi:predicted nuclease with TOPRIM domain
MATVSYDPDDPADCALEAKNLAEAAQFAANKLEVERCTLEEERDELAERVKELESRVEELEGELEEALAVEQTS